MADRLLALSTRHDQVHARLRREILLGEWPGGERLVETALAHRYGVSRTPIREALFRLAQEGLVEPLQHGGAVVKQVRERDIVEAYQVRSALEALAGRLAVGQVTESDLLDLDYVNRKTGLAMDAENLLAVLDLNSAFHAAIARLSRNRLLVRQLEAMRPYTYYCRRTMLRAIEGSPAARQVYLDHLEDNLADHRAVVDHLSHRRHDELATLLRGHMVKSSGCMVTILGMARGVTDDLVPDEAGNDLLSGLPVLRDDVAHHLLRGATGDGSLLDDGAALTSEWTA